MHHCLLEGFKKCVESTSSDITKSFLDAEKDLLNYGKYAARLPMAVEKVSLLSWSNGYNIISNCV